jgi:DNA repair protein RecN (Recombination protein N)
VIEELHIRGLGVIEDASLSLSPGLTVVTGETGAGKTMLVTALQLLLGGRASAGLVRRGTAAAVIEAVVRRPEPLPEDADPDIVELWGLAEDGVLIVSREVPAEGRGRVRIGGRLVPTATLAQLLRPYVEVHGQHEHVRLEQPAVQRALLDAYGGEEHLRLVADHRRAHADWADTERRRRLLEEDAAARARRLATLRAERAEIDAAELDPDRDEDLDREIDRLANADALRAALEVARDAAGSGGALDGLTAAAAAMRRSPVEDPGVSALADRLGAVARELSEVVADIASLSDEVEADDARLDALQLRKRDVASLQRRFGATVRDVIAFRDELHREIGDLEAIEEDAEGIAAAVAEAHARLEVTAAALTRSRQQVAESLVDVVAAHLVELGMPHATLHVALEPLPEPGPDGAERVTMLLAANPGEPPARLADAASGGERSRVALALEVVLADQKGSGVLVFDEVDAGVGGATALAVGEKLARLAGPRAASGSERQVLCVTHLAQVAAYAARHHVVEKRVVDGRTVTEVREVAEADRVEVLARMLGGDVTAGAGLEHARRLLDAAQAVGGPSEG